MKIVDQIINDLDADPERINGLGYRLHDVGYANPDHEPTMWFYFLANRVFGCDDS